MGTAFVSFAALYPPLLQWKCLQILDHPPSSIYLKVVRTPIFTCRESCPDAESLPLVSVHSLDEKSGRRIKAEAWEGQVTRSRILVLVL